MDVAFIGHVDAGKSTLCGQILVRTNTIDKQLIEKYKQASNTNFLSWITDTLDDERAKGKTQDINIMQFSTPKRTYTMIDTPGHKGYVPQMINGISRADVAILIISARTGEFESGFNGGQTAEHLLIARSFGVKYIIIAVNKMTTVNWSQERLKFIIDTFTPYIKKRVGFKDNEFCYIPIDALSGEGVDKLLSTLDSLPDIKHDGPLLLPISEKTKDPETSSIYIYGKPIRGVVHENDSLVVKPGNQHVTVKKIIDDMTFIIDNDDVKVGQCLVSSSCSTNPSNKVVAKIRNISNHLMTAGYKGIFHIHAERADVMIDKSKKHLIFPDEVVEVKLKFSREIYAEPGMRFLIRDEDGTVAIGTIVKLCS